MSADRITDAIVKNVAKPQSMSGDGISVSNRSMSDLLATKKLIDANAAVDAIANGNGFFAGFRMVPPGAGGRDVDGC